MRRGFNVTHNTNFSTMEIQENRGVFFFFFFYNDRATALVYAYKKQLLIGIGFIVTQLKITRIS